MAQRGELPGSSQYNNNGYTQQASHPGHAPDYQYSFFIQEAKLLYYSRCHNMYVTWNEPAIALNMARVLWGRGLSPNPRCGSPEEAAAAIGMEFVGEGIWRATVLKRGVMGA
jgi:hypothetical protein